VRSLSGRYTDADDVAEGIGGDARHFAMSRWVCRVRDSLVENLRRVRVEGRQRAHCAQEDAPSDRVRTGSPP